MSRSEVKLDVDCGHCITEEDRCSDESDRNCMTRNFRVVSDDHSNHNLPIGAMVQHLRTDGDVDLYTQGGVDDDVAIDPRDLEKVEGWIRCHVHGGGDQRCQPGYHTLCTERAEKAMDHEFVVTITGCTTKEAEQVIAERIGYDEDYGFDYEIGWRHP